ncbi:MAG: ATP-binding protein [Deltaproteobacteria bacterium]|nr:ATP-binding protein [Deltaproteobacteria bacterium]
MLKTVRVPPELEPLFAVAEEAVSRFFARREDDAEHGTIEIFDERYILVRGASLSVEFFELMEQLFGQKNATEADQFARNILFDLAHALGKSDAANFHRRMNLVDPIAKLSAGPVHFSHAGWAFVDILPESRPLPNDDYYLLFDHPYSFESDAWLRAGKGRPFPVCVMNAGYSSGWCEESFGVHLVSLEVLCRAKGDATCRFIMAPPQRIEAHVRAFQATHEVPPGREESYEIPDFFARKRAEEELQHLYDRLKDLDALKTQFFANVSHELRTPLMLISGPVEKLLGDEQLTGEQRASLEIVKRNARTLARQVDELLDIAKLEAGRMEARYAKTDVAELVRLISANLAVLAGEHIDLRVDVERHLIADVDAEKIGRVVGNLLSNAVKFARSVVRVTLRTDGQQAILEVGDDGPGVPPLLRTLVFERFRQVEGEGVRRFGGTGLGLAIAKDFVELHKGTIAIGDAPEGGALFTITIPLAAPESAAVEALAPSLDVNDVLPIKGAERAPPAATAPAGAPLVLVVEDNADMLRFVAEIFAGEYRLETAADGQEGLDKAIAHAPDLIVTDVMMPRLSGDELVRAVRDHPLLDDTPILVLTARADDDLRVRLLGEGAQDYLAKPFSAEELRARARNLVAIKRSRDALRERSAVREGAILAVALDCIVGMDHEGVVTEFNPAAERTFGRARVDVIGERLANLIAPPSSGADPRLIDGAAAGERREVSALRADGTVFPAEIAVCQIPGSAPPAFIAFLRDLTEAKRAAEVLRLEEQRRLLHEQAVRAAAEDAVRVRDDFVATAGHELKTPLAALLMQVQSIQRNLLTAEPGRLAERLDKVARAGLRMEVLVNQLLDVSQITAGRLRLEPEAFDLVDLVHEIVDRFADASLRASSPISVRGRASVQGWWDRQRIDLVLTNLVGNAIKYGQGKAIEIECGMEAGAAAIRVIDHGIGIDEGHQRKIFQRFERAVAAREFGGFGLGLWIAQQIADASGGGIAVTSAPNLGSTFTLLLPLDGAEGSRGIAP